MINPKENEKSLIPMVYIYRIDGVDIINGEYFIPVIFYDGRTLPWYLISNYGRIYSRYKSRLLTPFKDSSGYYRIGVVINTEGKTVFTGVHKLELMSFYPIEDPYRFIPNHKDGNKSNNFIGNLEWVTVSGNTRHALDNGLCDYIGTNNSRSYLTDDQVESICQLIKEGYSAHEIATKLQLGTANQNERNKICAIIRNIRYGSAYMSISMKYDIPGMQGDYRFPEEMAYDICKIMSDPNNYWFTYDDLAIELNVPETRRRYFKSFVQDIFKKAGYKDALNTYPNAKRPNPIPKYHPRYHLYF